MGGGTEVLEFGALEFIVGGAVHFFENAVGTNFVAESDDVFDARVEPRFVPNPEVFLVFEKFALVTGGDRAEDGAPKFRLEVDFVLERASVARFEV